jgi:glycosyltransferase involved in cell wall biosynthesis
VRILKIFDGDYPWDVRVEKVSRTLVDAGHDVHLVCRNKRGDRPRREVLDDGVDVTRVPAWGPAAASLPVFFSPLWVATVMGAARRFDPELVLARDLPMAPLATFVANRRGIPVVADLAEPYPDSLRSIYQFNDPSLVDRLVRSPAAADAVERRVVRRIDHAIVVCPEAGERLERVGLPAGRWTVVRNTPLTSHFERSGKMPAELGGFEDRFVLLFSGILAGDRGLDTAIEAVERLNARQPGRFALLVVGEGPVRQRLERQVEHSGLADTVRFTGWVDYARLPDIISSCDVGLLPFHRCPHIEASLANKLFEYMSLGLPVVASDVAPHRTVLADAGNGVLVEPGDAEALAVGIESLAEDPERLRACAAAGVRASQDQYNWKRDSERLLEVIADAVPNSEPSAAAAVPPGSAHPTLDSASTDPGSAR